MKAISFIAVGFAACLVACSQPTTTPAEDTVFEIENAYVVSPPAGMENSSGGMVIKVMGKPARLMSASADFAETTELHTMKMDGDKMVMRQVESFDLAEGLPLTLKRGGNHLMFFGLKETLIPGEQVDVSLTFQIAGGDAQTIITTADVVDIGAR